MKSISKKIQLTLGRIGPKLRGKARTMDTLMQATMRVREIGDPAHRLRAVAAYEDSVTDARVSEFCTNLARQVGAGCELDKQMWLLSELRIPRLRAIAAQDAAQAHLIIVSVHHCEELPGELQSWLELWLARKHGRRTLLLALLDPAYLGVSANLRAYLESVAQKAHSEFLVQSEDGASYS